MEVIALVMIAIGLTSLSLVRNYTLMEAILVGEVGYLGIVLALNLKAVQFDDAGGVVAALLALVLAAVEGAVNLALMVCHHRISNTNVVDLISNLKS